MKKLLASVVSAAVLIAGSCLNVSAENVNMLPNYEFRGNVCGEVVIKPDVDRDVRVRISQVTADGDYNYYDITLGNEGRKSDDVYLFALEGSRFEEVYYKLEIGVPEYLGSDDFQMTSYNIKVEDTEYITDETISKYSYFVSVIGNNESDNISVSSSGAPVKDENNAVNSSLNFEFPIRDVMIGDVDMSGTINIFDAVAVAQYTVHKKELTDLQLIAADYTKNGVVDIFDAVEIAKTTVM